MTPFQTEPTYEASSDGAQGLLLFSFLERATHRWPDQIAVDVPPNEGHQSRVQITYKSLSQQSNTLAQILGQWVKRECVVGIFLPRNSAQLYIAQLGVLKAGGAYTCIDPSFPDERVRDVLEDSEAVMVLTDVDGLIRMQRIGSSIAAVLDVGAALELRGDTPVSPPFIPWLTPSSLAYVIYTSGTTGRPKGVLIEHRSIANLVSGDLAEFQLGPGDRVGQSSSAAYDSSVEETWLALASGATVVVMDDATTRLGPDLVPWLRREGITVFCPPPTLLRALGCENPEQALPDLKHLYVGGEALPRDVADRWAPGRRLVNGYGPTECAVTSLRGDVLKGGTITIGKPVPGLLAWILDESLTRVSGEEQGELCLGGVGLSRGYWKRPELTAEKFIEHPQLGRLYRTGDLVHCDSQGLYHFHGRIDSQVKIRGYRIELSGIESRLIECPGVRAAACHVQDKEINPILVAFLVPEDPASPPSFKVITSLLEADFPSYMVPARFGILTDLPTTIGGKLNRAALPHLEDVDGQSNRVVIPPRNSMEALLERGFCSILRLSGPCSVEDDFFKQLGGDSLSAALLVTLLRDDSLTAWVTVRDIYEARTIAGLARRASAAVEPKTLAEAPSSSHRQGHPFWVTVAQACWLLTLFSIGSWGTYLVAFWFLPQITQRVGVFTALLSAPLCLIFGFALYTPISVGFAVIMKRLLIGTYRPMRAPVWSGFYLRNWIVQQSVRLVPWRSLEGPFLQQAVLRALGARIGRRVHIHRGVNLLMGGWDLLEIGDDVTLNRDAELGLVELDAGEIVVGSVSLGAGSTLDIRASVGSGTVLDSGAYLTALSSLPSGGHIPSHQRWDGIPAQKKGPAPERPLVSGESKGLSAIMYAVALCFGRLSTTLFLTLPFAGMTWIMCRLRGVDFHDFLDWIYGSHPSGAACFFGLVVVIISVPLTLLFGAAWVRLIGRVPEGNIHQWSVNFVRVMLKIGLVESAGKWLSGTLFWPVWLQCAGMKVGKGCEISTIIDVVPEHIEIGEETFLADGIYLGGPRIHQGVVTLAKTKLGRSNFLGNHVVVSAGQRLPDEILLGVCTVADDSMLRAGSSWFGLPPFELPRREVVDYDRSLTHEPTWIRYCDRLFWELLRFALPVTPFFTLILWYRALAAADTAGGSRSILLAAPLVSFCLVSSVCFLVLALKWLLLGRVRPGQHALWSCWCSRWDFLYVAWGQYAALPLTTLEGTLLLSWYLRAMGMKLGARVVLGRGFAHVVDPDMIHIEEGATVNAMYQAHTFEDRVLKLDYIYVRRWATLGSRSVPLYGADVGERTHVAPHSVIMKRERLIPGRYYVGAPTR